MDMSSARGANTHLFFKVKLRSEVKFIMVDPKKLELSVYKALVNYHLITSEDIDEYRHEIDKLNNKIY